MEGVREREVEAPRVRPPAAAPAPAPVRELAPLRLEPGLPPLLPLRWEVADRRVVEPCVADTPARASCRVKSRHLSLRVWQRTHDSKSYSAVSCGKGTHGVSPTRQGAIVGTSFLWTMRHTQSIKKTGSPMDTDKNHLDRFPKGGQLLGVLLALAVL